MCIFALIKRKKNVLKRNIIISFLLVGILVFIANEVYSQRLHKDKLPRADVMQTRTLHRIDSLKLDSLRMDSLHPKKKQPLDAPVVYEASDSIVFEKGGYAHLYGDGKVDYQKIDLTAQIISMNLDSSTVKAIGVTDSLGNIKGKPVFKDGDTPYDTKQIRYDFKTKKGFINNVVTQQGEGYVTSNEAKKDSADILYMLNGKYTTCDHHEHPHFYLKLTRAKVRPKKYCVAGPAYLVVEDVPLYPLAVPFFFFPFTSSYSSGFIMPTYMDDSSRGFGLTDGGYYFAISDMMDLKLTGDIFTKGSWSMAAATNYNKRYKYSGSLSADYQVTKTGDKNMPDYSVKKDFKISWNHRQDTKASPNSTFSANVNFATTSYERSNINNLYNSTLLTQNTKTSSVSYSRSFPDQNLTLSATSNISQTMSDSSISMTLPDLNIALSRIYPFKKKNAVGDEKWYEKISMSYTGRLTNSIDTHMDKIFHSGISAWTHAMNHSIPVSATFTLFDFLQVSPSIKYIERWYTSKINKTYNTTDKALEALPGDTISGFYRVANYSASLSLSTKLYGIYKPLFFKKKEIQIRHVFTPQVSISGAPAFDKYWNSYTDYNGKKQYYSPYSSQPYGVPSREGSGTVAFSVSNNVEMKYRAKNDSLKKVSLIDELGASISYNMAAASKPWGNLNMNLRLKLTKNYTFSMSSSFATYAYTFNKSGEVVVGDRTEWSYGRFGRFQGYGSSLSYTLNNDTFKKLFGSKDDGKDKKTERDKVGGPDQQKDSDDPKQNDTNEKKVVKAQADADGYQVFKMPWSISLNYSFNIRENQSKPINVHNMRYPFKYTHSLNMNGNLKMSNKWSFSFNSGYDFQEHKITQTSCNITRDLHCFTMTTSLAPFGTYKYYSFTIRANASVLQDLKWDQRSQTQSNIQWY